MATKELPRFSGENPEFWIDAMEEVLCNSQIPYEQYVQFASQYLIEVARLWFIENQHKLGRDWCAFSYHLLWEFDPAVEMPKGEELESVDEAGSKEDKSRDIESIVSLDTDEEEQVAETVVPATTLAAETDALLQLYQWSEKEIILVDGKRCSRSNELVINGLAEKVVHSREDQLGFAVQLFDEMPNRDVKGFPQSIIRDYESVYTEERVSFMFLPPLPFTRMLLPMIFNSLSSGIPKLLATGSLVLLVLLAGFFPPSTQVILG